MRYIAIFLLLAACAPRQPDPASEEALRNSDACNRAAYTGIVGRTPASVALGGLNTHIIRPGRGAPGAFVPERLLIYVNDTNIITRIACG